MTVNRYPVATVHVSVNKTDHAIHWIVIYPVDNSIIHLWNFENKDSLTAGTQNNEQAGLKL